MKRLRWQIVIILVTGLVVGLLLIGQQPINQPVINAPQTGGIYTEAVIGGFQRLNPLLDYYNQADRDVNRLIFSSIVRYDSQGLPQLDLAESMGVSKDGLTYNFALRQDVVWHDGTPFSADDVIFTIELLREDDSIVPSDLKNFWKDIQVTAFNEYTLQFILPEPFAPFLDYLTFGVLPQHLLGGLRFEEITSSTFNLKPVGTGPFKMDQIMVESNVVGGLELVANPDYYGKKPYLEEIIIRYYPNSAAALQAYQDGLVQGISSISVDVLPAALKSETLSVYSSRKPEITLIFLNQNQEQLKFLQNVNVRRALMTSINRNQLIAQVLNGQAIPADSPIFPGSWAYYATEPFRYDLEEAVNYLKDEGYIFSQEGDLVRSKDGEYLRFTMIHPDDEIHVALATAIQASWKRIGVDVTLTPMPYDDLIDQKLVNRDFDAALVDINLSSYPDPDPYPFWHQAQATGGQNYSQWNNRTASEYLEQARVALDRGDRIKMYTNFQVIFRKEVPALLLYYPVYSYGVDAQVQGVQIGSLYDPSDRFSTITDWFLVMRRSANPIQATAVP